MSDGGGGCLDAPGPLRPQPRVLLTPEQIKGAVTSLLEGDAFTFDVETVETIEARASGAPNPHTNTLLWIGFGGLGQTHLIPCGHPKGILLEPAHKKQVPRCLLYPKDDPRYWTPKTHKPSMTMEDVPVPERYADPPEQLDPYEVLELVKPLMFSDLSKIGHNVKFDLMTVAKYYGEIPPGPYHDTVLVKHTLDEDLQTYNFKELVCDWFGVPRERRAAWYPNLGAKGVENFGLDVAARYLAKDVRYDWLYFQKHYPLLVRRGLKKVYDFEMSLYPVIMRMEMEGFPVDLSKMDEVRTDLEEQIETIEDVVYDMADGQFPLSNLNAKRWVLFGEGDPIKGTDMDPESLTYGHPTGLLTSQNLRVRSRTKKQEAPQVTQQVLEFYADKGNKMADLLLQWSGYEKLRGTFIEGLSRFRTYHPDGDRVHTSYKQHGTTTGRLTASTPNLQQLPRRSKSVHGIRELFVARPGYVLVVADYDQIELRVAAFLSGDPTMTKIFEEGRDIHAEAAVAMFQVTLAMVDEIMRDTGKTANFGTLYGAGEERVAMVAGVSKRKGGEFLERYYAQFSSLRPWKEHVLAQARKLEDSANPGIHPASVVIPPFGRLRRLPALNYFSREDYGVRSHAERQAVNAKVQGFASYITKLAMLELDVKLPPSCRMIAQVHDEIVVSVPKDLVDDVKPLITEVMSGISHPATGLPILGKIPLVVTPGVGQSWAEAKKKGV